MADEGEVVQTIKCSYCDQNGKIMKLCTKCRAIIYWTNNDRCIRCEIGSGSYSSKECQLKDWPIHKKKCSKTRSRSERNTTLNGSSERNTTMNETLSRDEIVKEKEEKYESENYCYASTAIDDSKEDFKHCITTREEMHQRKQDVKCSQISGKKDSIPVDEETCRSSSSKKDMGEVLMLHTREFNNTENGDLNHLLIQTKNVLHSNDTITIYIKHNKEKKRLEILKTEPRDESDSAFQQISAFLRIPAAKLKLIHKGKMVTAENVNTFLNHGALFLAFGEVCECEDGLDKNDIDTLMKQLNVDRNVAVKALRKTGTLLDAIFDIGNRL